jgi:predicted DNA-binding transcriptional regulator YafY
VRFVDRTAAQRVVEANWHPSQRFEAAPDGGLLMLLDVGGVLEITPWLLSSGAAVEVLEPPTLRENIARVARDMAARYSYVRA